MPAELPTGTVTLLFTDIEGSTRMLQELGREPYVRALTEHRRLLREAFTSHGGVEVEMQGDSFHFAFPYARDAVAAAVAGQRALAEHAWESQPIKVRIGLHTGEPMQADGLYAGLDVHHAARVMSAAHGGQVLLSARTAELVQGELGEELALVSLGQHRLKDLSAPQPLFQAVAGGLPSKFPPLKTLRASMTNLPVQQNRLIGREADLAAIVDRLRGDQTRLLTLTGPGGTGKTKLALHAAAELVDHFADGVLFIPLGTIRDPSRVVPAIAHTAAAREQSASSPEESLSEFLGTKQLLLVLDNFEQVVEAAVDLARLLASASGLRVLVTSREPLRITGESVYAVSTLSVPADGADNATILANGAVALFAERAAAVDSTFAVNEANASKIAAICNRLEGLPLAIELAAARTGVLSLDAIAARLDRQLELLTGGARDVDERQRTLEATIAWSDDLLTDEEKRLFRGVSVFAGGCRPEAARAVCDPVGDLGLDVFDGLCSLASKSLLRRRDDPDGEPRFWMLNTIREYARRHLAESDDAGELQRRHAEWCTELAAAGARGFYSARQLEWMQRLGAEYENVREALEWTLHNDGDAAHRLVADLAEFWDLRAEVTEGRRWVAAVLEAHPTGSRREIARVVLTDGLLAFTRGDITHSIAQCEHVADEARHIGDEPLLARALTEAAWGRAILGEAERAKALSEEALVLATRHDDRWTVASATHCKAVALGDDPAARGLFETAQKIYREIGDSFYRTRVVGNYGCLLLEQGDYRLAGGYFEESRALAHEIDDVIQVANSSIDLAVCRFFAGELTQARSALAEALAILIRVRSRRIAVEALVLAAAIAQSSGAEMTAWQLAGAAEALLSQTQSSQTKAEERLLATLTEPSSDAAVSAASGRTLGLDAALRAALETVDLPNGDVPLATGEVSHRA